MQILYYYTQCNVVSVWWMLVREGGDFLEIYPLLDGGLHPDQMNFDKNAPTLDLLACKNQIIIANHSLISFLFWGGGEGGWPAASQVQNNLS